MSAVAGIDLAAGRGITEVAVLLMEDESRHPVFDASTYRQVTTDEEIVAAVAAAHPAVIAIDAPLTLPRAVVRGLGVGGSLPNDEALAVEAARSPYTRAAERAPIWSTLGIRPLPVSFLGGLTFRAISLLPQLRTAVPGAAIIEVFPSATLRCLGIKSQTAGTKAGKAAEATRRIVQRGLLAHIDGIAAPENIVYGADLLDALAAALTGVMFLRGRYIVAGDVAEGAIVLPDHSV
jgi:predicted nuclease with RNAse H fold